MESRFRRFALPSNRADQVSFSRKPHLFPFLVESRQMWIVSCGINLDSTVMAVACCCEQLLTGKIDKILKNPSKNAVLLGFLKWWWEMDCRS